MSETPAGEHSADKDAHDAECEREYTPNGYIFIDCACHIRRAMAAAWDEGHKAPRRRGPDNCQCGAWSAGECACGRYGTGELLSLSANPYRLIASAGCSMCGADGCAYDDPDLCPQATVIASAETAEGSSDE